MLPRERVLAALARRPVDRVPYIEHLFDGRVAAQMAGGVEQLTDDPVALEMFRSPDKTTQQRAGFRIEPDISRAVGRDNVTFWESIYLFPDKQIALRNPEQAELEYGADGVLKSWDDLDKLVFRPLDDEFWDQAQAFVENKGEFAACAIFFMGIDPCWNSIGFADFAMALYKQPDFIHEVMARITDWSAELVEGLCKLDFDFLWAADDIAFGTSTMFSPRHYREMLLPHVRKVADKITKPWIFHSDGNLTPILDDLLSLGMDALHPFEPGALDPVEVKQRYGDRIAIVGNISVDLLSRGTPAQVRAETRQRIEELAPGYGYLLSSSNSVAEYCKPENVAAMIETVREFGRYDREIRPGPAAPFHTA